MENLPFIIPGRDVEINMTLKALEATAEFILTHPMEPGQDFRIEMTNGKYLIIHMK